MKYVLIAALLLFVCGSALPLHAQEQQKIFMTTQKVSANTDSSAFWEQVKQANKLRFKAPDSCLLLYREILEKAKSAHYNNGIAEALISISILYHDKGDLPQSLHTLQTAVPYCNASTYQNGHYQIILNNNFAALYTERNISDSAAFYYYESLKIFEQKKSTDTSLLLMIYSNLGGLWVNSNQYDLALKYLQKGYDIAMKVSDDRQRGEIFCNIAEAYGGKHMYDTAIYFAKKALVFSKKSGDVYLEKYTCYDIGSFYLHKHEPSVAIEYYKEALESGDNIPVYLKILAITDMAKAYHELKKYAIAEDYYQQVLNLNAENYRSDLAETYNDMALLYADIKDYKSALKYKNLSSALKDSALNAERITATSQMEVKYRLSEKDKQIVKNQLLLTQQELKLKQNNIWIGSILGGLTLLSVLSLAIYIGGKRKRKLQLVQIASMQREQEIAQLKAKINGAEEERIRIARELHDGIMVQFSSVKMNLSCMLDNFSDPGGKDAVKNIVVQLDNATRELRKSAHNLMPDMLLQEGLTEAVHYFLTGLKQGSGIDIHFQHYGDIPHITSEYQLMLYRIIQELSQNALKHAQASNIYIQLNYRENMIILTVEDNGIGFDENVQKTNGIGLKNIQSRVLSLNGNMEINSKQKVGTTIYIEFDTQNLK